MTVHIAEPDGRVTLCCGRTRQDVWAEGGITTTPPDCPDAVRYLQATVPAAPPNPPQQPSHLITVDGDLVREVSRVQHDKTLQLVRDVLDKIPLARSAADLKAELLDELRNLRDQG